MTGHSGIRYEEGLDDDEHRHKGGLCYELGHTGEYWYYRPEGPFHVDGIHYDRSTNCGASAVRLMIDYIVEVDLDLDAAAFIFCSLPPTAQELDDWVRYGQLPLVGDRA